MIINLNDSTLLDNQGSSIFNGGNAGRVEDVTITIEPKAKDDESRSPDAKIFFEDKSGKINMGFYHHTDNDSFDEKTNARFAQDNIVRLLSIAKCLVPSDFEFPDVTGKTQKEIETLLLSVIKKYEGGKANVFAAYGTKNKPKKYLEVRRYNFIEKAGTPLEKSKLSAVNTDLMERPEATENVGSSFGGTTANNPFETKGSESNIWG